jgi:hypothetical protein
MPKQFFVLTAILVLLLSVASCSKTATQNRNANVVAESTPDKPPPSPLTGFDSDLQFIKNGGYTYIYVFSRKDGKALAPEDSAFLRANAPQMVDWARTREGKAVIGGTNFNLEEGNMGELKKRFVVEDYTGK